MGLALRVLEEWQVQQIVAIRAIRRLACVAFVALASLSLSACQPAGDPINSPYADGEEHENTLFTAFTQRSPRYLDPARS